MPSEVSFDQKRPHFPAPQPTAASATKAMRVLAAFGGASGPLGVSELARRSGTSKSTAFRVLNALAEQGFVIRVDTKYELSWQVFELGNQVRSRGAQGLLQIAGPVLADLYGAVRYSVHLFTLDGDASLVIGGIRCHDAPPQVPRVGDRAPAHQCAAGKALLAFSDRHTLQSYFQGRDPEASAAISRPKALLEELKAVRTDGVARSVNEWRTGLAEVAAPVILGGRPVAAISVSLPVLAQFPTRHAAAARAAAHQLARAHARAA